MSRAVQKSTKVDGLDIVDPPQWSVASRPKFSVYSCKSTKLNNNTNKGNFLLQVIIFWSTCVFIGATTENRFIINISNLVRLTLYFATLNQTAELR